MSKIAVIVGSTRSKGNTMALADAFIEGAELSHNEVEKITVAGKHIRGCIGCNMCSKNENNKCILNDDMIDIYAQLADADVIVFATPIYFYGVSSRLKSIIDRLHNPIRNNFKVKKLCLLAVCADNDDSTFDPVIQMYKSCLNYFSLEDGGIITVKNVEKDGDILNNPLLEKAKKLGESI